MLMLPRQERCSIESVLDLHDPLEKLPLAYMMAMRAKAAGDRRHAENVEKHGRADAKENSPAMWELGLGKMASGV